MTSRRARTGFTLIEMLVVIAIIGVLVGLLLPAISAARESARRAKCLSNQRNLALGILGYVNDFGVFPPSGMFGEDSATQANLTGDPSKIDPSKSVIVAQFLPASGSQSTSQSRQGVPMYSYVVPILPYIDNQELFNQWTMYFLGGSQSYLAAFNPTDTTKAGNLQIGNTSIGVLVCPDDVTIRTGQGNLSYVVNSGYTLAPGYPLGWGSSADDGAAGLAHWCKWAPESLGIGGVVGVTSKLGVMFPESTFGQANTSFPIPWNVRSAIAGVVDGASNTIMLAENTLTGFSASPTSFSMNLPTNWACPFPTFTSFIGASTVCGGKKLVYDIDWDCTEGQLTPNLGVDGYGWALTNVAGSPGSINGGRGLTVEGSYPYPNSAHPGGVNMAFCDGGARFIRANIDGTVYSKLLTPAGSNLPPAVRQLPLDQDAFAQ
jgi:prepilin-type N-terminal cleavage/methylation domain-containing protein/prepilin-type processing-associated H-X9-DG protein